MFKFDRAYKAILDYITENFTSIYTLAKCAEQEGIDLTKLNRNEYIHYAELHNCHLTSDMIRMNPQMRVACTDEQMQQILNTNNLAQDKQTRKFYRMSASHQASPNKEILPGVVIHPETTTNNMWLYYFINGGLTSQQGSIPKSYIGLKSVNYFQAQDWLLFLQQLQNAGFCGSVKTAQDPQQTRELSDQIVMHGNTQADAKLGLQVARKHFSNKIAFEDVGQDVEYNGKWYSHTQWLALNHKQRMHNKVKQ